MLRLPHQHFASSDDRSTIVKRVRKVEQFELLRLLYHKRNDDLDHRRSPVLPQIDDEPLSFAVNEQIARHSASSLHCLASSRGFVRKLQAHFILDEPVVFLKVEMKARHSGQLEGVWCR